MDQTEKYSQQLAEGMRAGPPPASNKGSTPNSACQSDEEFCPSGAVSSDDEETIAAAEKEDTTENSHKDEIEALQRESQMELDEFLSELPKDYLANRDKIKVLIVDYIPKKEGLRNLLFYFQSFFITQFGTKIINLNSSVFFFLY